MDIQTGSFFKNEWLAVHTVIALLYRDQINPATPRSQKTPMKSERNEQIRRRFADGESLGELAHAYSISMQRVHQIIYGYS